MNCFEARQDFAAFWRRELTAAKRATLRAHLAQCSRCERAFRAFALTAPVLHSETEPPERRRARWTLARDSRQRSGSRSARSPRREAPRWTAICAAATLFLAASVAAWLSVTIPTDSLGDAMSTREQSPAAQLFEPGTAGAGNDLAG